MDNETRVSIIVPVYNCEQYLDGCIQSILGQTYQNIELLLIDDGATDGSSEICDHYGNCEGVQVIHQKNAGVSCARNTGIVRSSGQYIMFVDSDDTIERNMVEILVQSLQKEKADCAFCGLIHDYPDHSRNFPEQPVQKVTDGRGAVREVLINYIAIAGPVCKLFRRDLLETEEDTGIFPADLTIGEDAAAVVQALQGAERVVFDTRPLYHYNHREQSLMSAKYSERDRDLIEAYERIAGYLAGQQLEDEVMFRRIWAHFHVYDKMILSGNCVQAGEKELVRWLRSHFPTILRNPYVGKMRKISLCALVISKKLYHKIIWHRCR